LIGTSEEGFWNGLTLAEQEKGDVNKCRQSLQQAARVKK